MTRIEKHRNALAKNVSDAQHGLVHERIALKLRILNIENTETLMKIFRLLYKNISKHTSKSVTDTKKCQKLFNGNY